MAEYKKALICENGHVIECEIYPDEIVPQEYCEECGENIISKCPNCYQNIRGKKILYMGGIPNYDEYESPSFCYGCGEPYPWIKNSIDAMMELMILENSFSEAERIEMKKALMDLTNESSKTELGVLKVKKFYKRVSPGLKNLFVDIVFKVASDSISQKLGLNNNN